MDNLIQKLSISVSSAQTLEELTRPLLEMLEAVTGCESTYLTSIDLEQGVQQVLVSRNSRQMQIPEGFEVPWTNTLCKRALDEGRPYTNQVSQHWGEVEAARHLGIQTYVSTPVHTERGELCGTLCAASSQSVPLPENAQHVLQLFSKLIGQHMERERLLLQLESANAELAAASLTDQLTGLPNRRSLMADLRKLLANCVRNETSALVAFVDLDGFKAINDTHGHDAGDAFLVAIGHRLSTELRATDTLVRIGGDEFVVIGPGPAVGEDADAAARGFARHFAAATVGEFRVGPAVLHYRGASVGAVAVDAQRTDADAALRRADEAMYEVKRSRRAAGA